MVTAQFLGGVFPQHKAVVYDSRQMISSTGWPRGPGSFGSLDSIFCLLECVLPQTGL